ETQYRNETTFALSNGYIGSRGTFEEGYDFSEEEGMEGNFINGFYESESIRYGEWNFGFPTESQSLLNLPNLKTIRLWIDEEEFDMGVGEMESYGRTLHMKEGIVSRDLIWKSPKGKKIKLHTERLVSFSHKNIMAISYQVTPLNFTGTLRLRTELRSQVENHTRKTNPLVDYGPFGKHLEADKMKSDETGFFYQGTTKNSRLTMACGSRNRVFREGKEEKEEKLLKCEIEKEQITYTLLGREKETISMENFICYSSMLDMAPEKLEDFIQTELNRACREGYAEIKAEQKAYLSSFWKSADVKIYGDDSLQQGIRFNLFHTMQAVGRDGKTGMGAKGLSGEGYEGHYFWDTEMYILPVFAYTDSKLAKSILDYRYHTIEDARDRARVLGHPKGALYPWRTINGKEASTYFPLGTAQYHINGDIAYACKLYVDVTGDYNYLEENAAEILIETARVWADVGCFAESKGNRYCICAVTGPDEYNAIVDNNFYTNLMARENLRDAIWALNTIKERNRKAYEALIQRLEIEPEEVPYWQRIVENMYFPFDETRKIYPLDDGFMQRKPWDDSKIP
ncbi:MAG: glycoside hydrolase family 65 protein, partial [Acetivibrio sp.]